MRTKAIIHETGNGLPGVGDHVPGDDGNLYEIVATDGRISTGSPGVGNSIDAEVTLSDWEDCDEDDVFPARATLASEVGL